MELTECGEQDREDFFLKFINFIFVENRTNNPTFLLSGQLTGEAEPCNVITINTNILFRLRSNRNSTQDPALCS